MHFAQALPALGGGLLIGVAAAALLLFEGRIAGISGVVGGLLPPRGDVAWRAWFLAGLFAGGVALRLFAPEVFGRGPLASLGTLAIAGLLVGYGTRLANGCTSGHGVVGLGRRSPRSLAAVVTFMSVGIAVVFVVRHLLPGGVG